MKKSEKEFAKSLLFLGGATVIPFGAVNLVVCLYSLKHLTNAIKFEVKSNEFEYENINFKKFVKKI